MDAHFSSAENGKMEWKHFSDLTLRVFRNAQVFTQ